MNKKEIGKNAENYAAEYLKSLGYEITERNWSCRLGEIDIIARDGDELVFAEIRCRKKTSAITPADTVSYSKQIRIRNAIEQYICDNNLNMRVRFDFVGVLYSQICGEVCFEIQCHLKNTELAE